MRLPDSWFRFAYRHGFRAARWIWSIRPPRHRGALVMLWCEGRVLLVRSSYQRGWMAPGGGIGPGEQPVEAACRELREELGLHLDPGALAFALEAEHLWNSRRDRVWFFEATIRPGLELSVDGRELVEARWFAWEEARGLETSPHIQDYLAWRGGDCHTGSAGGRFHD